MLSASLNKTFSSFFLWDVTNKVDKYVAQFLLRHLAHPHLPQPKPGSCLVFVYGLILLVGDSSRFLINWFISSLRKAAPFGSPSGLGPLSCLFINHTYRARRVVAIDFPSRHRILSITVQECNCVVRTPVWTDLSRLGRFPHVTRHLMCAILCLASWLSQNCNLRR